MYADHLLLMTLSLCVRDSTFFCHNWINSIEDFEDGPTAFHAALSWYMQVNNFKGFLN
jgi:hypothetical protein